MLFHVNQEYRADVSLSPNRFSKSDETVYPYDMRTAKRFVEYYTCGTEGKNGGKPTTHSTDGFWRRFSAAWARETRNPISYKIKKSVKNVYALLSLFLSLMTFQDADLDSSFMGHSRRSTTFQPRDERSTSLHCQIQGSDKNSYGARIGTITSTRDTESRMVGRTCSSSVLLVESASFLSPVPTLELVEASATK